jgi:dTDP-4-dehydrorhamnose reductase
MKVHVLGCNGTLGSYISKYLERCGYNVIPYDRNSLDVYTFNQKDFIHNISLDDVIINCIGLLKPAITSYQEAIIINKNFPLALDAISKNVGCNLINFSSDCVFTGAKGNYIETDECDALDYYGLTKRQDEITSTVMRLSFIGEERYNKRGFLEFALRNKGGAVQGYSNCLWNGLTSLEIAKLIDKMIRKDGTTFWSGVRHVFSNQVISKFELLKIVNKIYKLNLTIHDHRASEITGTSIDTILDRTLSSIYPELQAPSIESMIAEQREFTQFL